HLRAHLLGGAAVVDDGGVWRHRRPRAELGRAQAQVGFLAIHEEPRVEAAQSLPEIALDEEEATGHDIDVAHRGAVPAAIALGVEELAPWKEAGQAGGPAEHVPKRHASPAGCWIERAIRVERAAAPDPRLRVLGGEFEQTIDGPVDDD